MLIICSITASISARAADEDISDLKDLTSAFDDPHMTSYDLAFFLATHGYGATPKDGCVVLVLKGSTYNLMISEIPSCSRMMYRTTSKGLELN